MQWIKLFRIEYNNKMQIIMPLSENHKITAFRALPLESMHLQIDLFRLAHVLDLTMR